jgi:hypothetical protein
MGDKLYGLKARRADYVAALIGKSYTGAFTVDELNNKFLTRGMTGNEIEAIREPNNEEQKSLSARDTQHLNELKIRWKVDDKDESQLPMDEHDAQARSCKIGLEKFRVHFVLDGIDFTRAVNIGDEKEKNGYTNKELRCAFRIIEEKRKEGVVILFYAQGKKVDPPWITDRQAWEQYKRRKPISQET